MDAWRRSCLWNAAVYLASLHSFGVPIWKNFVVTAVVFVATRMRYGSLWIFRAGVLLMFVAIAVWLQALPPPQQWPDAQQLLARLRG